MSKELFYDYHCSNCKATYISNEVETECHYCGSKSLVIEIQRPKIIRVRKKSEREKLDEALDAMQEPDYEWMNDVSQKR